MRKILVLLKLILVFPFRIKTKISPLSIIRGSVFMKTTAISSFCNVYNSEIGGYSYLGKNTSVYHTKIGNFTSISDGCIIGPGNHPLDRLSTSPVFYAKNNIFGKSFATVDYEDYKETIIGNDVWVGTHVFIKSGVTIGDGAVIGACSVVTKDVEPYSIVAGNPAKFIKKRFEDAIIERIMTKEWWNWSDEEIHNNIEFFTDFRVSKGVDNSDCF